MTHEFKYFCVKQVRCHQSEHAANLLVVLDIYQTMESHASFISLLSNSFNVTCLTFQNHAIDTDTIHWMPSAEELEHELKTMHQYCESDYVCCIAQGFGATVAQKLRCSRDMDILCNPSMAGHETEMARRLSSLLIGSTNQSRWFNSLLHNTWKENLSWPFHGPSPWLSVLSETQTLLARTPTNGTWKRVLQLIQTTSYTASPNQIIIFAGSETTFTELSPENLAARFTDSSIQFQIFSGLRQELLLAEPVQQDILKVCKEQV